MLEIGYEIITKKEVRLQPSKEALAFRMRGGALLELPIEIKSLRNQAEIIFF